MIAFLLELRRVIASMFLATALLAAVAFVQGNITDFELTSNQATPLVGKNEFLLAIPRGAADNLPSWNEITGHQANDIFNARKDRIQIEKRSAIIAPMLHKKTVSPSVENSSKSEKAAEIILLADLLSKRQRQSKRLKSQHFPFDTCFVREFSRKEIRDCVKLQYSIYSRRANMRIRNIIDRLEMKQLEIRALKTEFSEISSKLSHDEQVFTDDDLSNQQYSRKNKGIWNDVSTHSNAQNNEMRSTALSNKDLPPVRHLNKKAESLWAFLRILVILGIFFCQIYALNKIGAGRRFDQKTKDR